MSRVSIAIDVPGGDYGASVTLPAAFSFLRKYSDAQLCLVGDYDDIVAFVPRDLAPRCEIVHANQVVDMDEAPAKALRRKRESSMWKTIALVKEQRADICVSAGNTGALMAMSNAILKTHSGVARPAIMGLFPASSGKEIAILDLGADISATAESLCQYALLASSIMGGRQGQLPRVALLNVGHEAIKGTATVKAAHQMLLEQEQIHYVGFIEGNQIFFDAADIIVCDGFVGNIVLKSLEGMAKLLYQGFKDNIKKQPWFAALGKTPLRRILTNVFEPYSTEHRGGAIFVGLNGLVVKCHGNAREKAFLSGIELAYNTARGCDKAAYAAAGAMAQVKQDIIA